MWEIKQSATPQTVDIYIYSAVESDSEDWWTGEKIASETSANTFRDKLGEIKDIDNINIYINSLGGSVMEGVAIYNQLKRHKAQKTVYVDGFACSIASVIAMAGDKIVMPKNTVMMIHNAWTYCRGNAPELRKMADDLDKINEVGKQAYLDKANGKITAEELTALMDSETYLTAEECIKYGFADEYSEHNADIERAKSMLEEAQKNNAKQFCDKLTKICAIADKSTIPQTETFESKAINTINKIFGGNIDVKY